ncbi:MAG: DNA polymerase IV [Deltaproteobacteria bacterium]|nr:DNA polymerase IV [Deltaproteobacteria bacterium]
MDKQVQSKHIIHLDMDAFYPSVEMLDNPALKGKPVIVGGRKERGVVSSASYEARKFRVHSAQPIAKAKRLCPDGIFLPVRMSRYQEVSKQVFEIFHRFTPLVEPISIDEAFLDVTGSIRLFGQPEISIDEAFLDVTGSIRLFGQPENIAKNIKQIILTETGLTISAGVAPSKFVAKIASDIDKPDGLTVVHPDGVRDFLDPLPVKKMWGVGKVTQLLLSRLNIQTFRDLRQTPVKVLEKKFGKHGVKIHLLAMGIDERDVIPEHDVKSIGHEQTFSQDIISLDVAQKGLLALGNKVARRMRHKGLKGKTITLKVKYFDFIQITRSTTLPKPTDHGLEIYSVACRLLKKTEVTKKPIRLLGISLSQLSFLGVGTQLSLFDQDRSSRKRQRLNTVLDLLYEKFGDKSVVHGTLLND